MAQPRRTFFWLLLAATLSIDAVVFSRAGSTAPSIDASVGLYYTVICDALLASQLSIICIWSALHVEKILWLPMLAAVLAATTIAALSQGSFETLIATFQMYGSYYGLEAGLLLAGLWLFRGSKYWRTRSGAGRAWQFSLAHLFLLMTV